MTSSTARAPWRASEEPALAFAVLPQRIAPLRASHLSSAAPHGHMQRSALMPIACTFVGAVVAGQHLSRQAAAPRRARRKFRGSRVVSTAKGKKEVSKYKSTVLVGKTEFSQRANAKKREPEIQELWNELQVYETLQAREGAKGKFTLHDGPPYANGALHMGHALNKILKDVINKYKSARGYNVKFVPGWDCHGLPIELKVLQSLKPAERKDLDSVSLRKKAEDFALQTVEEQSRGFQRFGVYGEFDDPYLTLQPEYEAAQLEVFEEMVRGGHIYRAMKPVYWSPSTQTALAESELEYPEGHVSPSIYVGFQCTKITEEFEKATNITSAAGLEVAVWTTTPWTIPANRAVAVNPDLEYAVVSTAAEGEKPRRLVVADGLVEQLGKVLCATVEVEARFPGKTLEGMEYTHPLLGSTSPVVLGGDYITTESGTGLVHTAPGHGNDDYIVGMKYDLEVAAPLDNAGNYTEDVGIESLVGSNVLKDANEKVCTLLKEKGALLKEEPYTHKYPYDWRSKKPVITRATPQWFASIDGLRDEVLTALEGVRFIPDGYVNRMRPMILGRNDWCISRQRSWGVPIPVFYRKDNGDALIEPDVIAHVRGIVAKQGTSAWYELPEKDLLPDEYKADAEQYIKGTDTMDVWFDSGSSWAALRSKLGTPVDLYFEGQDQHRGWFQSSLITSVATQGTAPYKTVMTHGFAIDQNGRKMSKSIGNVIDPFVIIEGGKDQKQEPPFGADILRLWASTVDFTADVPISQSIMKSVADNAIKLRNTARFMLANISDFDAKAHTVAYEDLPLLDKHTIREAERLFEEMAEDFDEYMFPKAMRKMILFGQGLSALYLDVAKDRLYIAKENSLARRSCQTVLRWLVEQMARAVAPVLCHLAEDVWQNLKHSPGAEKSVLLAGWVEPFPRDSNPPHEVLDRFDQILQLRDPTNAALQKARDAGLISSTLEAQVEVRMQGGSPLTGSLHECLEVSPCPEVDTLSLLLKVSEAVACVTDDSEPTEMAVESDELKVTVVISRAKGQKCERCWVFSPTVGDSAAHPTLCHRCADVVESLEASEARVPEVV